MRKLVVFWILGLVLPLPAEDWREFVLNTRSSENPLIMDLLERMDFTDKIAVYRGLGEREDPYCEPLLLAILLRSPQTRQVEICLLQFLTAVQERRGWEDSIAHNPKAYARMVEQVSAWENGFLKALLYGAYPALPSPLGLKAAILAGEELVEKYQLNGGTFLSRELEGYLIAARYFKDDPVIRDQYARLQGILAGRPDGKRLEPLDPLP